MKTTALNLPPSTEFLGHVESSINIGQVDISADDGGTTFTAT